MTWSQTYSIKTRIRPIPVIDFFSSNRSIIIVVILTAATSWVCLWTAWTTSIIGFIWVLIQLSFYSIQILRLIWYATYNKSQIDIICPILYSLFNMSCKLNMDHIIWFIHNGFLIQWKILLKWWLNIHLGQKSKAYRRLRIML